MKYYLQFSCVAFLLALPAVVLSAQSYEHFEARHTHSMALTPDGTRLLALNSPDASLSVFDVTGAAPVLTAEIPVGLEPVAVRARSNDEIWVVNEVSDSISIVSLNNGSVIDTLPTGDEPADIVFVPGKAYVTCSRQNVVKVYDTTTRSETGSIALDGLYPRSLAVSSDESKVYTVFQLSGNNTTVLSAAKAPAPPAPTNSALPPAPQTALIVSTSDPRIDYTVLDRDVAVIDVATSAVTYFGGLGTNLFDIAERPGNHELWVPNTEALNLVRFEPQLRGHFADNRLSRLTIPAGTVTTQDLNPGINYALLPNPAAQAAALAQPMSVVFTADGSIAWTAAFASDRVAKIDADTGTVVARVDVRIGLPNDSSAMRGPRALLLDEAGSRLFVLNKLSNTLSVVSTTSLDVTTEVPLGTFDPTPAKIKSGRGVLFDARLSGNGTMSCGTCHIDADRDGLAWDLGDPGGEMMTVLGANLSIHDTTPRSRVMHPMKGPMTTQTLRGMQDGAPFHWRGDRPQLQSFNPTFDKLMGGAQVALADMDALHDYLLTLRPHANPNRNRDRTLPTSFGTGNPVAGRDLFNNHLKSHCNVCHLLPTGSDNNIDLMTEVGSSQPIKNPPLRTIYQRNYFNGQAGTVSRTGFGLLHDGTGFVLPIVHPYVLDNLSTQAEFNDLAAFMQCFDSGTAPAVGISRTVTPSNRALSNIIADLDLLESQATAAGCDLVVRGKVGGQMRSLIFITTSDTYRFDSSADGTVTRSALLAQLAGSDSITFLGVLPGAGARLGGDRDGDGFLDRDDPNPTQPNGPPRIIQHPLSGAAAPGASYTFHVEVEGLNLTYKWKKGTTEISTATGNSCTISGITAADAGTYTVTVTNPQGFAVSNPAVLSVYPAPTITVQPLPRSVNEGQSASFTVTATGSGLTYQWYRGTNIIPGATSRTLTLSDVGIGDVGTYSVTVANGAGSKTSNSVALTIKLKPVVNPLNLPDAVVSQLYSYPVTAVNGVTSFSSNGLPPGLTLDKTSGVILGRPTASGDFTVTITATNAAGPSRIAATDVMHVDPFPIEAIGTFTGVLPRDFVLNNDLGGRFTLTTTTKGTFTGTVVFGTSSTPLSGVLDISAGVPPAASLSIPRKGKTSLLLNFTIDTGTRSLAGTLSGLSFTAEQPAFNAAPYAGDYTLAARLSAGDATNVTNPQGHSFGSFKVAKGIAGGSLRLADNTVVTFSLPVGNTGGMGLFALLYGNTGSLLGRLHINTAAAHQMSASSLSWFKRPQTASTRSYKGGFGPLNLDVVGGKYLAPAANQIVMGLHPGPGNARITFAGGGAPNPSRRLDTSTVELTAGSTVTAKILPPNPGIVTLSMVPSTGAFAGSFTLMDADPTVSPTKALIRTAAFSGVLVTEGLSQRGYGFFILPELPSSGPPKTSLSTSRLNSGSVLLQAAP